MLKPLYTLKKNKIYYSKFGVGKQVGSKIYFHKDFWRKIVPPEVWEKAIKIVSRDYKIHWFHTICYDLKEPHIVRFDTCDGFDIEDEPTVGTMVFVDIDKNAVIKESYNPQIYHHKWLWVSEEYEGFDTQKAWERSKEWSGLLHGVASGYRDKWENQLYTVGMK